MVLAEPVGVAEGRVGAEVEMEVAAEGIGVLGAEVGLNAAQGEVHPHDATYDPAISFEGSNMHGCPGLGPR